MKILYLLSAFLFLAFLSEPGNAQRQCFQVGGFCRLGRCPFDTSNIGKLGCPGRFMCCKSKIGK
ncbi:beta-defensin-like [Crotalus adamanteus]|uniref:Beta-defensin-like n=1 Tax=Crotalus adamanteus TaxID=8729 RepID=A0AAW1BUT9_CROAD